MLAHGLIQKLDCRFLFELEAVPHRGTGVDQQAHLQRQIRLRVETSNIRHRPVVIHKVKVRLLQIRYPLAMLVGYRKYHVYFVGAHPDFRDISVLRP